MQRRLKLVDWNVDRTSWGSPNSKLSGTNWNWSPTVKMQDNNRLEPEQGSLHWTDRRRPALDRMMRCVSYASLEWSRLLHRSRFIHEFRPASSRLCRSADRGGAWQQCYRLDPSVCSAFVEILVRRSLCLWWAGAHNYLWPKTWA